MPTADSSQDSLSQRLAKAVLLLPPMAEQGECAVLVAVSCRYQLMHTVRVHTGGDDDAYNCMGWGPDREGINGVWLRKDVPLQVRWQQSD